MPIFEFKGPDGQTHSIEGPEGATQEQAFQMLQKQLGGQPAPASPQADAAPPETQSTLGSIARGAAGVIPGGAAIAAGVPLAAQAVMHPIDSIKSIDAGIGKGLTLLGGMPSDLASLAHSVAPQSVIDKVKAVPGAQFLYNHLPGSEALKAIIPTDFSANYNKDAEYEPKDAAGRYTKAIATQLPMLATGMGLPAALGGAVAGQVAYDATGSHTAEAVGNFAGNIAAPLAMARNAARIQPLRSIKEVKNIADARYAEPAIKQTYLTAQAAKNVARDMRAELANAGSPFLPAQAPRVHAAIDALEATGNAGKPVTFADLHGLRKSLGEIGQETHDFKATEQALAAGNVKRVLGNYLDNVPNRDVIAGDPAKAAAAIKEAGRDWHAASSAQRIDNAISNATEQNASTGSAMNLGNVLRQKFRPFLMNDNAKLKSMGFGNDPEVVEGIRNVTRGDFATNALRHASNMLGGGGGIGSALIGASIGGGEGYREHGVLGGLAGSFIGALPGQGLRLLANSRTRKAAQAVQDALLAKAPANAGIVAANRAARAANKAAVQNALTRNGIPAAALLLSRLNGS
jgi:hypothetical protein